MIGAVECFFVPGMPSLADWAVHIGQVLHTLPWTNAVSTLHRFKVRKCSLKLLRHNWILKVAGGQANMWLGRHGSSRGNSTGLEGPD